MNFGVEEGTLPSIQDDLVAFQTEVLAKGAEAALPHNLTDEWLMRLLRSIRERKGEPPALAVMAIFAILGAKPELRCSKTISKSDLAICVDRYYADLVCEEFYRANGMFLRRRWFASRGDG